MVTSCNPYLCDELEAPNNGALMVPCDRAYGTTCSVFCSFGYTLDGPSTQTCVLVEGSTTEVKWTDPPVCNGKGC